MAVPEQMNLSSIQLSILNGCISSTSLHAGTIDAKELNVAMRYSSFFLFVWGEWSLRCNFKLMSYYLP